MHELIDMGCYGIGHAFSTTLLNTYDVRHYIRLQMLNLSCPSYMRTEIETSLHCFSMPLDAHHKCTHTSKHTTEALLAIIALVPIMNAHQPHTTPGRFPWQPHLSLMRFVGKCPVAHTFSAAAAATQVSGG